MCYCEFDPAEIYSTSFCVSRKPRKCYECGREIGIGERYRYTFAKTDGEIWQASTCMGCNAGIIWLSKHCGCWLHGNIREDLLEHFRDGHASISLGRLIINMGREWKHLDGSLISPPSQVPA